MKENDNRNDSGLTRKLAKVIIAAIVFAAVKGTSELFGPGAAILFLLIWLLG